jgi:hypothetical protein
MIGKLDSGTVGKVSAIYDDCAEVGDTVNILIPLPDGRIGDERGVLVEIIER